MLRIRFLNVGDGDAILIEELSAGRAFRMLVDAGRQLTPAPPTRTAPRCSGAPM